jgi:hypothetical protein
MRMPSGITCGKPTTSTTTSAPPATGQLEDARGPRPRLGHLGHVDRGVGPERPRELEPRGDAVDHDHGAGPELARDGGGVEPEPPGALDHDQVAETDVGPREAEDHLRERAVGARDERVVEVGRHLEDLLPAEETVVVGECAEEVRRLGARAHHGRERLQACVGMAP